jgi:hypothetical protein
MREDPVGAIGCWQCTVFNLVALPRQCLRKPAANQLAAAGPGIIGKVAADHQDPCHLTTSRDPKGLSGRGRSLVPGQKRHFLPVSISRTLQDSRSNPRQAMVFSLLSTGDS